MRNISTQMHGYIEYILAVILWFTPNIFNFEQLGGPAVSIPRMVAGAVVLLSLMTDFELGVIKVIPMKIHLMVDYLTSIFLMVSPFLFGFNDHSPNAWVPHVIAGLAYLGVSLMTQQSPSYSGSKRHAQI